MNSFFDDNFQALSFSHESTAPYSGYLCGDPTKPGQDMESQDLNQPEWPNEDDEMSGVVPTASIANSGPEVDVRLAASKPKIPADIQIEQR
jgi:hypothetical protein